jgi:Flp pilus assembly protein TadD
MEEAIEHYREIGDRASIAELTANLGVALLHAGQNERARLLLLRAAELFQESGQVQLAERARHMAA